MSPKSKVRSPKSAAACCVLRVACCAGDTHHAPRTTHSRAITHSTRLAPRAFTLIEIMIVVGIMGIVMAMSVPIVYKVWRKAPMRQAVKDIVEVCSHARARAIMQGHDDRGGLSSEGKPPGVGRRRQPVAPGQRSGRRSAAERAGGLRVRPVGAAFRARSSSRRWISTCRAWSSTTRRR